VATLIWLLGFALVTLPMSILFRRSRNRIKQLAESRFTTVSSPDLPQGEIVAVVTLSDWRKKMITGLMLSFVAVGFLASWGAGWGPQPDKAEWDAQWPILVSFIALGYFIGGVAPWLMAVFYAGEFRVVFKNGILKVSSLTKTYFVPWNQIVTVRVHQLESFRWWITVGTKKGSFSVWTDCPDFMVLVQGIISNVPMNAWESLVRRSKVSIEKESGEA
jgi:hypothetical protein